jgi:cytochrome c-type biogenesis protein CcmF
MLFAHVGVAVFVVGVTFVKGYETQRDVRLAPGESVTEGGFAFRFAGTRDRDGPNYRAVEGTVVVTRGQTPVAVLHPEKRFFIVQQTPMTEAAIDRGIFRDLYVALGEAAGGKGAWTLRIHVKPFVNWIWAGCLLMALGGLLAASDPRYRLRGAAARASTDDERGRHGPRAPALGMEARTAPEAGEGRR